MSRTLSFTTDADGERLDRFLAARCPDLSRSRLQQLIVGGHVRLGGAPPKTSSRLQAGQIVTVTIPDAIPSRPLPQDIPLAVVYQDAHFLVVDKPAGLTVHPGPGHPDRTLVNAVLALCPELRGIGDTSRPGIVHRLDKDTSGLMVVAKSEKTRAELAGQLKQGGFSKVYLALVHGRLSPSAAVIEAPIGRDPRNRKRMAVVSEGKKAATPYRVLRHYRRFTMVEVRPSTGRTHQVRVHFASISHPLAGDGTYGHRHPALGRHFLHSQVLGFRHPFTGEHMEFTSDLPDDLRAFLDSI